MIPFQCFIAATILGVCSAIHAQDFVWRKDGKPIADTDSQKARDGFGALLLLIDDKKFFDDWQKPDPPQLRTITNAKRMVPVHTTVIFAGAGRNEDGEAHVSCDVTIRKSDGSVYGEQRGMVATEGRQTLSPTVAAQRQPRARQVPAPSVISRSGAFEQQQPMCCPSPFALATLYQR